MDKSRVCMSQTINLAKQKNLQKTNLLVYEQAPKEPKSGKPPAYTVPRISTPPVKHIRVCTGAELKRMCRPPPCTCPPRRAHVTFLRRLQQLLGLGFKSLIAGSLIYYTWEAGLWGDSEETEQFYTNVCHLIAEGKARKDRLTEACEAEMELMQVPPPPEDMCSRPPFSKEKTMYRLKEAWNHTITFIFEGVVGFPFNLINWYKEKFTEECTPIKKE